MLSLQSGTRLDRSLMIKYPRPSPKVLNNTTNLIPLFQQYLTAFKQSTKGGVTGLYLRYKLVAVLCCLGEESLKLVSGPLYRVFDCVREIL